MKILKVTKKTVYYVETDEEDWPFYTRHGDNSWTNRMGCSEEDCYDDEIEHLFQEFIKAREDKE